MDWNIGINCPLEYLHKATTLVSLLFIYMLFIYMIPIAFKITIFSLYLFVYIFENTIILVV